MSPAHNTPPLMGAAWRSSSYSGGNNECVEIADNVPGLIPVRDSKRPNADILRFGRTAWRTFLRSLD
ncbi:DUF397 domain-containing protein [Streptomyces mayteni]